MQINKNKLVKYSITSALALTLATGYLNSPNAKASNLKSGLQNSKQVDSDSKQVDPDSKQVDPDSKQVNPDSKQVDPDSKQSDPDSKQSDPDSKQSDPDSKQADPDSKQSDPDSKQADPDSKQNNSLKISELPKGQMGSAANSLLLSQKNKKPNVPSEKVVNDTDKQDDQVSHEYDNIPYIYDDSKVYFIKHGQKVNINHLIDTYNGYKNNDKVFDYGLSLYKDDLSDDTYLYITNALKVNSENGIKNYDLKWTFSSVKGNVQEKSTKDGKPIPMATVGLGNSEGHAPFLQIKDWSEDTHSNNFIRTNMKFYKHDEDIDNQSNDNENLIKKNISNDDQLVHPNIYLQYYAFHGDAKFKIPSEQINEIIHNQETKVSSENGSTIISNTDNTTGKDAAFLMELKNTGRNGIDIDVSVSKKEYKYFKQAITPTKILIKNDYHGNKIVLSDTMSNKEGQKNEEKINTREIDNNNDEWILNQVKYDGHTWKLNGDNKWTEKGSNRSVNSVQDINITYSNKINKVNYYYVRTKEHASKNFTQIVKYLDMQGNNIENSSTEKRTIKYIKLFNTNGDLTGYQNENGEITTEEPKYEFSSFNIKHSIKGYTFKTKKDENNNTLITLYYDKDRSSDESKDKSSSNQIPSGNNEQQSTPAEDDAKINDIQNNQSQGTIDINKKDNNNSESNTNNNAAPSNHRKKRNQDDGKLAFNNKKSASNKITINGHKGNKSNSNNLIKRNNKNANKKAKINKSAKSNSVSSKDTPVTINHQNQPASVVNNVNNDKVKTLPQTGEKSGIAYTLSGLAMLMVSIFTFVFRRNKNK
ncbi:LPXTG cell wall anchor domain-containing protein [Apilactobacillus xinyiensis]|uniref:LPXTG cell wall anchor domain-containing protein n=1 Tax=Apilactobacillus xinyiensis TaxID=2841032 RepID=UPI0020104FA8|nr:LPXTG cell wall anchor domain-containing protein [Apilactobacillus xinyiensis]MCL0318917.1 LPXTG cell wall anchor domain-containing protein [Apilactobacillus xinyiensis]